MSHNTVISGVKITNMDALQAAIKELQAEGSQISFHTNGTFRTYRGQDPRCDATITLPGENYDIGLKKEADGSYTPIADFSMLGHNRAVACSIDRGERRTDRHAMGKLIQRYAVCVSEQEAALQGHMVTRSSNKVTGEIELTVEV